MWSLELSKSDEATKIRWECVPYFHGRILDIGCGEYKAFPHWIGVDNGKMWGKRNVDAPIEDAMHLDLFASQSCDGVFSSHLLEHIKFEHVVKTLTEWVRVIRQGGHLMLYLPEKSLYPSIGTHGANPDHKWEPTYESVVGAMEQVPRGWDLIQYEKRDQDDEYSMFMVFRIL